MKQVLLRFDSLSALAGFSKWVNDRGYVIIVKDLTLKTSLSDAELQIAIKQNGVKLLPFNKAAA